MKNNNQHILSKKEKDKVAKSISSHIQSCIEIFAAYLWGPQ